MKSFVDVFEPSEEAELTGAAKEEMPERSTDDISQLFTAVYASEKEAYEMYCNYAHDSGFSVRKEHHSYWPNSRRIKSKDFVCSKAGFKKDTDLNSNTKYRRSNTRTGCPAMVRFSVGQDGLWKVHKLIESHNHELARAEDQHLLRSCRNISDGKASVLKSMTDAGIRTVDAFAFLREEAGGVENVGFSKRDAYNFVQKERRAMIEIGDTNSLIELFKERQVHDHMFAWVVQTDEEDRLFNFFWVDGLGRIDYDCFGDVIIFDTSYRLNKYNLACAPIVGVNNHWQNVLLGVAFLSDETIESFTWLFKTFLRIMSDKQPKTIFTDQDQAMARAIEIALPQTRHRLCQWHISKKIPSNVWCFNSNQKFRDLYYRCLSKCDTEEEFERTWANMIIEGELESHEWLKDLYKIREKWSTAFNKNCFNLGILSTQRSECTNNVCHGMSKPTSNLTECFLGMERIMVNWRQNEHEEDFRCSQSDIVPIVKSSPILKQAAKFYTRKLYSFFEGEFLHGIGEMCIEYCTNDSSKYLVRSLDKKEEHSSLWTVHFDSVAGTIGCSCGKFEMMGILCSHSMRVIRQLDIVGIPQQYFLPRWSVRARKDIYSGQTYRNSRVKSSESSNCGGGLIFRNHISRFAYQISSRAQGNEDAEQYMLAALIEMAENVDFILDGKKNSHAFIRNSAAARKNQVHDPIKCRPKGISNARLKCHWEKRRRKKPKTSQQGNENSEPQTATTHGSAVNQQATTQIPSPYTTQPTFSFLPECLTDEFIFGRSTAAPSAEYTRLMMEIIETDMCKS